MKLKLLITDKIDESQIELLRALFSIDTMFGLTPQQLRKVIKPYHCVITRSGTAITKEIIESAPNLQIIARAGIGVDNIDIFEATRCKIAVINAPVGNAKVTAEHTIGLIFSLLRHIPSAYDDLKKGIWGKSKYVGTQIFGKTVGIVGFGNVGKEVYRIAHGIGLNVVVCEPYMRIPPKVRKVTFEDLLRESDIITFHVPQTYLTSHMINHKTISLCKKGVYIINCSRGAVVEEQAIIKGLRTGQVGGFAVDVFVKEPQVNLELFTFPNVIATPHIAGSTVESQRQSIHEVVNGIIGYLKGKPPSNLVNPQVFKKPTGRKIKTLTFDAVIFDCDSTLCAIEGVDELARKIGKEDEVGKLTSLAMDGLLNFEKVYEKRLKLIRPSYQQLTELGNTYIKKLVEDAKGVVAALQEAGKKVYIVSGGFSQALLHLGHSLGVDQQHIFGNDLIHDQQGKYLKFVDGPLRRNHGKLQIIRQIPGRKLVVGDSITDLETIEYIDLFIGYGGVIRRNNVEKIAPVYLYTRSLAPILVIAAGYEKCLALLSTPYRKYVGKGVDLLSHKAHVKVDKSMNGFLNEFKQLAYYNGVSI